MSIRIVLLFSLLALIASSCKPSEELVDYSKLSKKIVMQKNPCFGKCPVYILTIYENRFMVYEGRRFTEKYGIFTKKLSRSKYKAIKKAFQKADFQSFDDDYPSNIPDLPKTRISFFQNGKSKSVSGDIRRPIVVMDLEKKLEAIANSEGWKVRSVPDLNLPDYMITDELIVSVKKDIDIKDWITRYPDLKMEIKKSITPSRNLWLVKTNTSDLKPSQVMNTLLMDEDVLVLEFNKKPENR